MTIKEFVDVLDNGVSIVAEKSGEIVAVFDSEYVNSIIDDILNTEIGHISISVANKATTVTITDSETDNGGDAEPDDENP